ncbi:MAG: calcium/sodium antiporter [Nitriliruptoraceae bacterium]
MGLGTIAGLIGGAVLLVVGAEALVRGASRLAAAMGVTPLAIGLTVVAFGTSAPELAVSVQGAVGGAGDVAVGNAVGSNVFNLLAILGLAALTRALVVQQRIVRLDLPVLLVATLVVWGLAANGTLGRIEGSLLVAGLLAYTTWVYRASRREERGTDTSVTEHGAGSSLAEHSSGHEQGAADASPDEPRSRRTWPRAAAAIVLGLAGLVAGAQLLVGAATTIAVAAGVSELTIGLTVVATGTSLPELATSVAAAARGQRDIAVGNVVGSNLFNLLGVLGVAALVSPGGLPIAAEALRTDLPLSLLATIVVLPCLVTGLLILRWEGGLLLLAYVGYVTTVVLLGLSHPAGPTARVSISIGLVASTVVVTLIGWWDHRRRRAG